MRLKVGFILRSLLVIGTFLGLVLLWSSLSPKPSDEAPFEKRVSGLTLPLTLKKRVSKVLAVNGIRAASATSTRACFCDNAR